MSEKQTPIEKLHIRETLESEGFTFEKNGKHLVGTRTLSEKSFGTAVLCYDLDAIRNPWAVAPSLEASRITCTHVHDLENNDMKLAAEAQIGDLKKQLVPSSPEPAPAPSNVPAPAPEVPPAPSSFPETDPALVQIVKNVTQDGVKITKNTKGYNWEVSVHADDILTAVERAIAADDKLRKLLGVRE